MQRTIEIIRALSRLLKGYDCTLFKLIKPVSYVPSDVDLLINADQLKEIVVLGYEVAVTDPYCITLTKGDSIIDLYVHLSLGGVVFVNGQELLEHVTIKDFSGGEIKSLENYAEAIAAVFVLLAIISTNWRLKRRG